jgi:hypothetical protein
MGTELGISASSSDLLSDGLTFCLAISGFVRVKVKRPSSSSSLLLLLSRRSNTAVLYKDLDCKETTWPVRAALDINLSPRRSEDDCASDNSVSSSERKYAVSLYGSGYLASAAFALSRDVLRIVS